MTNEEIRKLLSGYATNTLTESESKLLFEAALDDQELFDALQKEQPLRELLDDPTARTQIRHALNAPATSKSWWSRGWAWGSLAAAMACAVLVIVVVRSSSSSSTQHGAPAASTAVPEGSQPEPPVSSHSIPRSAAVTAQSSVTKPAGRPEQSTFASVKKELDEKQAAAKDAAAPAISPAVSPAVSRQVASNEVSSTDQLQQARANQSQSPSSSQESVQVQPPAPAGMAFRDQQFTSRSGAAGALMSKAAAPGIRYSLLRRDSSGAFAPVSTDALRIGDAIRLSVTSPVAGVLSLARFDTVAGEWRPVGPSAPVTANITSTIPGMPIELQSSEERLRVTVTPYTLAGQVQAPRVVDVALTPRPAQ